jgi:hypothetical protein
MVTRNQAFKRKHRSFGFLARNLGIFRKTRFLNLPERCCFPRPCRIRMKNWEWAFSLARNQLNTTNEQNSALAPISS